MPNNRQHTIAGLEACGWKLDTTARTNKYQVYARTDKDYRLLVGKSGALRLTRGTISDAMSCTGGQMHLALQAVGRVAKSLTSVEQAQRMFESEL